MLSNVKLMAEADAAEDDRDVQYSTRSLAFRLYKVATWVDPAVVHAAL